MKRKLEIDYKKLYTGIDFSVYNLIKTGYFFEEIPSDLFSTIKFSDILNEKKIEELRDFAQINKYPTPCSRISIYKNEVERRLLNLMHIEKYFLLCDKINHLESDIKNKIFSSTFSQSKITLPFSTGIYNTISTFSKNREERIKYSVGYKYLLNIDLSKCYESIYTHAITWALYGKELSKQEYLKKEKNQNYIKFDELDFAVRQANNNETKGIPTGSISSRIISELILCEIDEVLKQKYPKIKCKRFVDDYKFYFHTKEEIEPFIWEFQQILHDFKLNINSKKTKIEEFPYEINFNLRNEFKICKTPEELIDRMLFLEVNKNKGAIKYGLKVLNKRLKKSPIKNQIVISQLLNILSTYPHFGNLIFEIFKTREEEISFPEELFNKILQVNIDKKYDGTIIWLLYFMMKFNIDISIENGHKILENKENFSTVVILDYIHKKRLWTEYKDGKEKLRESLQEESIYGEKWLLIYEIVKNDWIKGFKRELNKSKFLLELINQGIYFYESPLESIAK